MNRALIGYRLRKLRGLRAGDLAWLVRAQLALLAALVHVRTRPTGKLVTSSEAAAGEGTTPPSPAALADARRLALAVGRAAEHGVFRATCLVRSVALQRMLRARGHRGSRIQIGVRMKGGALLAHAWVEWEGEVLGDTPANTRSYAPLVDVDLVSLR